MATKINPKTYDVLENSPVVLMGTITLINGELAVQSDIDTMTLKVFEMNAGNTDGTLVVPISGDEGYEATILNKSEVIKNTPITPETDVRWEDDDLGCNFIVTLDGSYVPLGNKTYRVEVRITPTAGDQYSLVPWILKTYNLISF